MQYKIKYLLGLLLVASMSFAQKAPMKYGKVDSELVKMTTYEADPSAEAVVLADYGVTSVVYNQGEGFYLLFNRHRRIKILTKDGYDWADHEIYLYLDGKDRESVQGIKGTTYNLEGGKVKATKMGKKAIFKEKNSDNWNITKFTMPNVKEGSVIEYSYSVRSPFYFNLQDWYFQTSIPTIWSEYITKIPEYFSYQKFMQGYQTMSVNDQNTEQDRITLSMSSRGGQSAQETKSSFSTETVNFSRVDNRWVAKNVPAFKEEPYMSNSNNYISKVNFELAFTRFPGGSTNQYMGSWGDINKTFLEAQFFGGQLNNSPGFKSQVEKLIAGASNDTQKIIAITDFVRKHMTWNGVSRRTSTDDLRKAFESQEGSAADINLILVNMFRKAGLTSDPVLLSTRSNGMVREQFPLSSQFNYVIAGVQLPDRLMLIDATEKNLPINLLPQRCINGNGMRVSQTKPGWVDLTKSSNNSTLTTANFEIGEDGSLNGSTDIDYNGYAAYEVRESYQEKGDEYEAFIAGKNGWSIDKSELQQIEELEKPVKAHYEVKTTNGLEALGELIYLNPFVVGRIEENPFKLDQRAYPVDFVTPSKSTYNLTIKIPEGYKLEGMPENVELTLPNKGGSYVYTLKQVDGSVTINSELDISRAIFSGTEYTQLKKFFADIVDKQAEQLVLKKME